MKKLIKLESHDCPQCRLLDIMLGAAGVVPDEVVNIDDKPEAINEYDIMGVPVLIFLDDEGVEVDRISGTREVTPPLILDKLNS